MLNQKKGLDLYIDVLYIRYCLFKLILGMWSDKPC